MTQSRECFFGEIVNGTMVLNEMGKLAEHFWVEIPAHFVMMPNHVHEILIIDKNITAINANVMDVTVETRCIASLPSPTDVSISMDIQTPTI
ncbi:MAG: hypothetical protein M0P66_07725 [Salinivirgaceae bacterium]|nr:hypothetical protein [Salinivirgaceae bacterium]